MSQTANQALKLAAANQASALDWFKAASPILSGALQPSSGHSSASQYSPDSFDNSGWTVATSGSKATSVSPIPWTLIVCGAVVALLIWKKVK